MLGICLLFNIYTLNFHLIVVIVVMLGLKLLG